MKNKGEKEIYNLFEKKGKYKSVSNIFSIISILFLITDILLCIINFPYVRIIFNVSIILSLISIMTYVIFDYKLESTQKHILYLEDKNILNDKNIKKCLNEKEIIKINKDKEKYNDIKLINKISLDILIRLRENLEIENN